MFLKCRATLPTLKSLPLDRQRHVPLYLLIPDRWWILVALVALLLLACTNVTPTPTAAPVPATVPPIAASPTSAAPIPIPSTAAPVGTPTPVVVLQLPNVADTVERVRPAVVSIVAEAPTRDVFGVPRSAFGSGSGVIFDPQGLVLTNNHVVQGAVRVTVTMDDGRQVKAEVVGADRLSDLAVLRIPGNNHPFMPLGTDVKLRVGEWVIAIGNALALPGGPTVTVGVVSALGRSLEVSADATLYDLIQTDAGINPGNSGGPLVSLRGELIGINTAVLRGTTGSGAPIEGIGFAINMETAAQVSEQLIRLGRVRWAYMAVLLSELVPEVAAQVGLPVREGVVVQDVLPNGPAGKAGIRPGDIILALDGRKVSTVQELTRRLRQEFQVGQEIQAEVFREGSRRNIKVVLGERPR